MWIHKVNECAVIIGAIDRLVILLCLNIEELLKNGIKLCILCYLAGKNGKNNVLLLCQTTTIMGKCYDDHVSPESEIWRIFRKFFYY